jgi:hypothetical protein
LTVQAVVPIVYEPRDRGCSRASPTIAQYISRKSRAMPLLQTMVEKLQIPPDIVLQLLPNENITIINFLGFPLPLTAAPSSEIFTPKQFLSNHLPDVTSLDIIRSTPTPSEAIIRGLVSAIKAASDAVESITCPHVASASPKHFPVWLAAYWFELLLVRQIRKCWSSAEKGLQKIMGLQKDLANVKDTTQLVDHAYGVFTCLPWTGVLHGFSEAEPVWHLYKYATNDWLSTVHENQLLDVLRESFTRQQVTTAEIESTYFVNKLQEAYKTRLDMDTYRESQSFRWTRRQGQILVDRVRTHLGFIANSGGDHWVAVVLDFEANLIWHGDSLGRSIHPELRAVLEWWTYQHTATAFSLRTLPITQQRDGFSCGLLAYNSLAHFFLQTPLMDASRVAEERLKILISICHRHQDQSAAINTGEYKFTMKLPDFLSNETNHDPDFVAADATLATCNSEPDDSQLEVKGQEVDIRKEVEKGKVKPQVQSAIRVALQAEKGKAAPLLSYFKQCSREEYREDLARQKEEFNENLEDVKRAAKVAAHKKALDQQEQWRLRQERHRAIIRDREVVQGIRSPGGTKRKVREHWLICEDTVY